MTGAAAGDDGYTLAEVLVALFVIGLAVGGLTQGVRTIARLQGMAGQSAVGSRMARDAHAALNGLLAGAGPFSAAREDAFAGSPTAFRFACGAETACGAELTPAGGGMDLTLIGSDGAVRTVPLPHVAAARFSYAGSQTIGGAWPAASRAPQTLKSVGLIEITNTGEIPITSARIWLDQDADCQFDAIVMACRDTQQ